MRFLTQTITASWKHVYNSSTWRTSHKDTLPMWWDIYLSLCSFYILLFNLTFSAPSFKFIYFMYSKSITDQWIPYTYREQCFNSDTSEKGIPQVENASKIKTIWLKKLRSFKRRYTSVFLHESFHIKEYTER